MKEKEFYNLALIHVGAALVKCYDEKCDGIIGNMKAQAQLANEAESIAENLLANAWLDDDDNDEEEEEEEKEKAHHLVQEEELTADERRVKRMCEEYDQLMERWTRLIEFGLTDKYEELDSTRKGLLQKQSSAMRDYLRVLKRRIEVESKAAGLETKFKNPE